LRRIKWPLCAPQVLSPNPHWVSMVNMPWFGAYGHGEGRHAIHDWPSEIDFERIEADLATCRQNGVQVLRAFIFEDLDGLVKQGDFWHISGEAVANLRTLKALLQKYNLQLEAVLFEFHDDLVQPYVADFIAAQPFRPVVHGFVELMEEVLWAVDLHNEIDALFLQRHRSLQELEMAIAGFREIVKAAAPEVPYTCSTGWLGGYWAKRSRIGVEHLDFIEVHHYLDKHGEPWAAFNPLSLCGLETLDKPVLLGEFRSDDFDRYVPDCAQRGFLGAAPWSVFQDFPISPEVWKKIRDFRPAVNAT